MTEYAVTVKYYGDFVVTADSPEEAEAHVQSIMPTQPDSDFYLYEIDSVREED